MFIENVESFGSFDNKIALRQWVEQCKKRSVSKTWFMKYFNEAAEKLLDQKKGKKEIKITLVFFRKGFVVVLFKK